MEIAGATPTFAAFQLKRWVEEHRRTLKSKSRERRREKQTVTFEYWAMISKRFCGWEWGETKNFTHTED